MQISRSEIASKTSLKEPLRKYSIMDIFSWILQHIEDSSCEELFPQFFFVEKQSYTEK